MKKILIILGLALLASCMPQNPHGDNTQSETQTQAESTKQENNSDISADGVLKKVRYTLRENDENGQIIDSNEGEEHGNKPVLDVVLGAGSVIVGFDKNLRDMKAGETKSFTVSPEEGYGSATRVLTVSKREIAPEYTLVVTKEEISGKMTITQKISEIPAEVLKQLEGKKVGDIVEEDTTTEGGTVVKISEITDSQYSFEIVNKNTPFYGKEIKEGAEVGNKDGSYTITKVDGNNVTLLVKDNNGPFAGKEFVAGATAKIGENDIKIVSINDENQTVEVEVPNQHELAGKTLYFTVTVEDVIFPETKKEEETSPETDKKNLDKPTETQSEQQ